MDRCSNCKHFIPDQHQVPFGNCGRWEYGYATPIQELKLDEVLVENDEGWGAFVGPEFGCILHAAR